MRVYRNHINRPKVGKSHGAARRQRCATSGERRAGCDGEFKMGLRDQAEAAPPLIWRRQAAARRPKFGMHTASAGSSRVDLLRAVLSPDQRPRSRLIEAASPAFVPVGGLGWGDLRPRSGRRLSRRLPDCLAVDRVGV